MATETLNKTSLDTTVRLLDYAFKGSLKQAQKAFNFEDYVLETK